MKIRVVIPAMLLAAIAGGRPALADALSCERGIARAAAKHAQGLAKILYRCEDGKTRLKYRETTVCATDPLFDAARLALSTKLVVAINQACGGVNAACGDGDDEPLGATAWGSLGQCPDVGNAGCSNPITTCADVTQCVACIDEASVTDAVSLVYGAFEQAEFGTASAVNRCQRAIGKAAARYLATRSKVMQRCWDARAAGLHANACPDPGDGKAATRLASAEARKQNAICKVCGGVDRQCDGSGDLAPGTIGFVASCPAVTAPFPPTACGGAVGDAAALVACIDCVVDFDTDCGGAAATPAVVTLPASCNPAPASSTTTSSSSTTTTSTSTTSSSSVAATTSSTSTTAPVPTTTSTSSTTTSSTPDSTTTSTLSSTTTTSTSTSVTTTTGTGPSGFDFLSTTGTGNCGQTFRDTGGVTPLKNLLCGNLSLGGGLSLVPDNTTPAGATNRFALSCVGAACTVGPVAAGVPPAGKDCTDTGCPFGTPLPILNSGLSVCVTNTFSAPVSGTLNTTSGVATLNFQLNSKTALTANPTQPCPTCRVAVNGAICAGTNGSPCVGVCDGGPNQAHCVGGGSDGNICTVASECPGGTCLVPVCTSRNAAGVTADCPAPPVTLPTARCYRGTNNNKVCLTSGDCPGGTCASFIGDIAISLNPLTTGTATLSNLDPSVCTAVDTPYACCTGVGTGTCTGVFCPTQDAGQKGAFRSDICRGGANTGLPCTVNAQCPGSNCQTGTGVNYCVGGVNDGNGCFLASDCPSGTCTRAGTLVELIRATGLPTGALTIGVAKSIKLGVPFCVGATTNPTVNSNANLPAAGATGIVANVTLLP